jgi:arginine N-succinyltransferase
MYLIRQSRLQDADAILTVARHLDSVNLPAKEDRIAQILDVSQKSFNQEIDASEREYLFVLEEIASKRLIGTSMIYAQHGTKRAPHVYFSVLKEERYSQTVDRYFVHEALRLGYNYDGPTEIGGLILLPEFRRSEYRLGKLLSFVRFLFIAMHRPLFRDRMLAELLPPLQADGTSILWEHLGKRFTGLTYQEADLLSRDNKEFIHTLFPHSVIYTALFPKEVRDLIGQVGSHTRGVETMLRRIGFHYARRIDPFDGGPHFVAETDDVTVIKAARPRLVRAVDSADASRPWAIIAVTNKDGFRAMGSRVIPDIEQDTLGVPGRVREALGMAPGEQVWAVIP